METMQQKPGWKTSEFWVVILAAILPIADQLLQNAPQNAPWYAVASAIIAAGYAWSRAHQKVNVARATASVAIAQANAATAQAMQPVQGISNPVADWLQDRNIGAPTSTKQALEGLAATAITQLLPQVLDDNDSTGPQDDEVVVKQ